MPDVEHLPAERLAARQRGRFAAYVATEVHPFSPTDGPRLDRSGLGRRGLRELADLRRLAPLRVDDVDGIAAVLRPTAAGLDASAHRWRWRLARLIGRRAGFVDEHVEPDFRAIHFDDHGGLVVASTASDLDRLADLGRRMLDRLGVRTDDAVVSVLPARGDLAFWQVVSGCRRGGVPALHLGPGATRDDVAAYAPTVVVGRLETLAGLTDADEPSVRLVLVVGDGPLAPAERARIGGRFPSAAVRTAWAPRGVRALWSECDGGELHTWPDVEVVEVVGPDGRPVGEGSVGEVLWSPIDWHGTVVLRLATGLQAALAAGPCPACGRTSPRLEAALGAAAMAGASAGQAAAPDPEGQLEAALAGLLAGEPLVADWFATDTAEGLVVELAPPPGRRAALESDLGRLGAALGADRLVVARPSRVAAQIEASGGRRVDLG